jgi:hypothetical protein
MADRIAWMSSITHKHAPTASPEYQRRAQACWASANNNHIIHLHAFLSLFLKKPRLSGRIRRPNWSGKMRGHSLCIWQNGGVIDLAASRMKL